MSDGVRLSDPALSGVVRALADAAQRMVSDNAARPAGMLPSLSGIGWELSEYLRGAALARAALADAAKTAGRTAGELMERSTDLDRRTSSALSSRFSVK